MLHLYLSLVIQLSCLVSTVWTAKEKLLDVIDLMAWEIVTELRKKENIILFKLLSFNPLSSTILSTFPTLQIESGLFWVSKG